MTTEAIAAPVADWIDPEEMFRNPYPVYERLRAASPVAWVPFLNSYVAADHAACRTIEMETAIFSADRPTATRRAIGRSSLIDSDDPQHERERRPVNPGLRPKFVKERWTADFEANARVYLDALAEAGPDGADLNTVFASPLAAKNLMTVLGLKGVEVGVVREWSATLMLGVADVEEKNPAVWRKVDAIRTEIDSYLEELLSHVRAHPDGTFTSALASSGLPDDAVMANVKLAIAGGINEPQHAVTSIVWALSEHLDQRTAVLAEPELWPAVFDETLRWISPLGLIPRLVVQDTVLDGVRIPAGSQMIALIASGNRDERVFENADVFDIHRPKIGHLAFGSGVHMCAGMWVARWSIGNIAVPMLYRRFQGLRHRADEASWFGLMVRGLQALPVVWDDDLGNR